MAKTIVVSKKINDLPLEDHAWQRLLSDYQPMPLSSLIRHAILDKVSKGIRLIEEIDGREKVKEDVLRALLSGSHTYLVSEEGTGKTRLAKSLLQLLPPILSIRGCPYKDDPKWPRDKLCPTCRQSRDPINELGVEVIPCHQRFSRIQGNEYTNEAKLLGIKDIQALVQGKVPSDPTIFIGTGIFNANRGILFIDELPAIRTKVQVLLHPVLEEKLAILEEYNWKREVDLLMVATGNPIGFVHINEVPRPLLDRMELIYMDFPESSVEQEIMEKESFPGSFLISSGNEINDEEHWTFYLPEPPERKVWIPWWLREVICRTVRLTRSCPQLDKKAGIRGTIKAFDHAISSAELRNDRLVNMEDALKGLQLALRGRVSLRFEFQNYDNPKAVYEKVNRIVEDLTRIAIEEVANDISQECSPWLSNREQLKESLNALLKMNHLFTKNQFNRYPVIAYILDWLKEVEERKIQEKDLFIDHAKKTVIRDILSNEGKIKDSWIRSGMEILIQMALFDKIIEPQLARNHFFIPRLLNES